MKKKLIVLAVVVAVIVGLLAYYQYVPFWLIWSDDACYSHMPLCSPISVRSHLSNRLVRLSLQSPFAICFHMA